MFSATMDFSCWIVVTVYFLAGEDHCGREQVEPRCKGEGRGCELQDSTVKIKFNPKATSHQLCDLQRLQ